MILIDKGRLKFLLAGREIDLTINPGKREYHAGRSYAVGTRHNHTICRAKLRKLTELSDSEITMKLVLSEDDQFRLLGKTGGYVSSPSKAMDDDPGEAVDKETQDKLTELGTLRWRRENAERDHERTKRSLRVRINDALKRDDVAALRRLRVEMERVERRIEEMRDAA